MTFLQPFKAVSPSVQKNVHVTVYKAMQSSISLGGRVRPGPPTPPKKRSRYLVTQKTALKLAVLGSLQPVHVHGRGGGGEATTHVTDTEPCRYNIANVIQLHSMAFTAITHSDNIFLLTAATTT